MISKTFLVAGRATFTTQPAQKYIDANAQAGVEVKPHYTFRISRKEASGEFQEAWFVSLLTGQDNEHDYTYLGILDISSGSVRLTAKSAYKADSQPVRILQRILGRIWMDESQIIEQAGWKVQHEGKCGRCGRTLTTPVSLELGIGPECAKMAA